jgi:choline dehydrogenase-like flavoprotein
MTDIVPDVAIIGSGPAGVSAAWPLIDGGLKVLMLDQGRNSDVPRHLAGSLSQILWQTDDTQWRELLGEELLLGEDVLSTPKLKVPQFRYVQRGFKEAYGLSSDTVRITGSLALGGLSNMWGAGTYCYVGPDFSAYPLPLNALASSYSSVADRIAISGVADDDLSSFLGDIPLQPPLPLHQNAAHLLAQYAYKRRLLSRIGLKLGRARNAVLTANRPGRDVCTLDKMCLWGCRHGAIYSAAHELNALTRNHNFVLRRYAFVERLEPNRDGGYFLQYRDLEQPGEGYQTQTAPCVLLAAGTIGSAILAIDALGLFNRPHPILLHPAMGFAFLLPSRIGTAEEENGFALGQLAYRVDFGGLPHDYAFGVVFSAEGLLASELTRHMPLSRPAAAAAARALLPGMMLANCYLPSDYADATISCRRDGEVRRAEISGRVLPSFEKRFGQVRNIMRKAFGHLGAYLLPGGAQRAELGSDGHYAGAIPMTVERRPLSSTEAGEVRGLPNVFSVDGASLPRLTGKHPTFTIMANADRISRRLAARLKL